MSRVNLYKLRVELRGIQDDIENLCKHLSYCTDERFDRIVSQIKGLRAEEGLLQKRIIIEEDEL